MRIPKMTYWRCKLRTKESQSTLKEFSDTIAGIGNYGNYCVVVIVNFLAAFLATVVEKCKKIEDSWLLLIF